MPLFRRSDGVLVRDEAPVRMMLPHLSWGRNASAVYHQTLIEIGAARDWLRAYNRAQPTQRATHFHLFLWAVGRALHARPRLNRFVSGGRLYQRHGVVLSFTAKQEMALDAPMVTLKVPFPDPEEPFARLAARVQEEIAAGRAGGRTVDRELALGARLPHWFVRPIMALYRVLDRFNVLPASMIDGDPSFSSLFVANLGSVGLDGTWHHLFELGNCSLFACLGTARGRVLPGANGLPVVRPTLEVRWTFDERIADGLYCASALRLVAEILERPELTLGAPADAARASHAGRPGSSSAPAMRVASSTANPP
jgi:hypothetical protein